MGLKLSFGVELVPVFGPSESFDLGENMVASRKMTSQRNKT
jgi:hypothetical protein